MSILNGLDAYICVTDPDTCEILYLNDRIRKSFGIESDAAGQFCFKILQNVNERCGFCPYFQLKKEPDKIIVWEQQEPVINKIFRKTAMLIDWSNGKKGHLEYGIDITDIVHTQKVLQYHDNMLTAYKNIAIAFSQNDKPFGDVITNIVSLVADAVSLDRVAIWRRWTKPDGSYASQIYRWDKDSGGSTLPTTKLDNIHYSKFAPDWDSIFSNGECLNGPVSQMHGGDIFKEYGTISAFLSPVFVNSHFWGVTIFEDRHKELVYDKEQADIMKSAAHLCVNAIIRKEMMFEIAEQSDFNRIIFETAPIGFAMFNENYNLIDCNEYMSNMCGVSKEYYIEHFYDLLPKYQTNEVLSTHKAREMMKRAFNGETVIDEWIHCKLSGELVPCEVTLIRIKRNDKFIGLGYVYDLHNIKKLEQSVIEAEDRVKLILDATPMSCNLWDRNLNIIDCNDAAVKLFGAKDKQDYVENFFKFSPEYQPDGQRSIEKADMYLKKAFDEGGCTCEWTHLFRDGTLIPVEIKFARLEYKSDYIVIAYMIDMREHKRMIDEIEMALFKIQEANRAKSDFLSRMSHEMLTPMNAIIGIMQLFKHQSGTENIKEYIDKIDISSRYLLRLINDLLDMSGMEDGTFSLTKSVFSFNKMFRDVLKEVGYLAIERRQNLLYDLDTAIPSSLLGDSKRLAQVIINLLTNAIKFTPEQGTINFSASLLGKDNEMAIIRVDVKDNGIGISEEEQNKLFSTFEQMDGGLTRKYGGTGHGLAFSKKIIELMGGKIWVFSENNKGSTFSFTCKIKEL
ncbi:MAG: PAS domain-containing protein [Deferribacteraceae bacterium]|nr:PAS domain-containing protein [Deferribacteraceae bacterium]